ncbi:dienelactone hydrolase family protein [Planctomicrobium sp. SH668]|uniref:dienelactone hydrolase family protein n=1 Tax=Planctomicrobium sp. SH668 TaxID=3448126 RepID=UPI003F5C5EDE
MRNLWPIVQRAAFVLLTMTSVTQVVRAEVQTKEVTYDHDGLELKGYLAWDDAVNEKRPGVLVVHEWWGLNDYAKARTEQLAAEGYVAFAVDMYGGGKVTVQATQAAGFVGTVRSDRQKWRARALAGLDVLKEHPSVDADKLAAIGYCFGGSTAIELAYAGAPLKGVVSFHGALTPPAVDSTVAPEVLVFTGAADSSIPAAQIDAFAFGMEQTKSKYTIVVFGGARHGFTNPKAGDYGVDNLKYDRSADVRSWTAMKLFFDDIFSN